MGLALVGAPVARAANPPSPDAAPSSLSPDPAPSAGAAPVAAPRAVIRVQRPVAQAVQRPVTAVTSPARPATVTAPPPKPVRHRRTHRRRARVVHPVAAPDVMVAVPISRVGASSRDSLLGIAGAVLLALAAAGAVVTVREVRT